MRSILPPIAPRPMCRLHTGCQNNPNLLPCKPIPPPTQWLFAPNSVRLRPTICSRPDGKPADTPVIAFAERTDGDNSRDI